MGVIGAVVVAAVVLVGDGCWLAHASSLHVLLAVCATMPLHCCLRIPQPTGGESDGIQVVSTTAAISDPLAVAAFAAIDAIVTATPDTGEGGRWHERSDFAWMVRDDYMRADDPATWEAWDPEYQSAEKIRAACVRSALKAAARWAQEDAR